MGKNMHAADVRHFRKPVNEFGQGIAGGGRVFLGRAIVEKAAGRRPGVKHGDAAETPVAGDLREPETRLVIAHIEAMDIEQNIAVRSDAPRNMAGEFGVKLGIRRARAGSPRRNVLADLPIRRRAAPPCPAHGPAARRSAARRSAHPPRRLRSTRRVRPCGSRRRSIAMERGSAAGSPAPDRPIEAQPAARIMAPANTQPQSGRAIAAAARTDAARQWPVLVTSRFGSNGAHFRKTALYALPMNAAKLAGKLTRRHGSLGFALPPVSGRQTCSECGQATKQSFDVKGRRGQKNCPRNRISADLEEWQFFRELNYDLKFRHRNNEFNFQFLKFNRANVDSWSERPHFACSLFCSCSLGPPHSTT